MISRPPAFEAAKRTFILAKASPLESASYGNSVWKAFRIKRLGGAKNKFASPAQKRRMIIEVGDGADWNRENNDCRKKGMVVLENSQRK